ncbi:nonribosomal peptide synthetase MxaA, partial [Methylobacterium haplocladii]
MRRLALLLLALIALPGSLQAQVRSVEVRTLRPFGYFVGDLVRVQVDIMVDDGFTVQAASLPQPGPITYWLDLRDIAVEETAEDDARRIRLHLTYQSFYAALDARTLEIPGFALTVASDRKDGVTSAKAQVPAWSINVSPLREIQPPPREDPTEYMRPDGRTAPLEVAPSLRWAGVFAGLALLALAVLARDRAWGPFGRRRGRAFAGVQRNLRTLVRRPDHEAAYREALIALHRGLDETDGRRVLADDLPAFLDRHPAYRQQESGLARFFTASRLAFFG